ncbi:hypothetical protein [Massilia sp. TN1-12]|uniref:hypothetical protein n=1 Tax=Massilia paldalensis TaxID=3377675 RepID=UPI003850C160
MTPEQQAELRAQVRADEACATPYAERDIHELARILSAGRVRQSAREIGNGTIIETLGIEAGNKLLDHIANDNNLRHVRPLLYQGRLIVGAPLVQAALQSYVALPDVLSQEGADKMCALGREPDPLGPLDVAEALYNPDGTEKA